MVERHPFYPDDFGHCAYPDCFELRRIPVHRPAVNPVRFEETELNIHRGLAERKIIEQVCAQGGVPERLFKEGERGETEKSQD